MSLICVAVKPFPSFSFASSWRNLRLAYHTAASVSTTVTTKPTTVRIGNILRKRARFF